MRESASHASVGVAPRDSSQVRLFSCKEPADARGKKDATTSRVIDVLLSATETGGEVALEGDSETS